ncbi:MAG TPA: hypothetical protein VEH27_17105 [Methylomirabilota bacterium]|nr:hypothetical protein [Methylomirabilota bacterium]
MGPTDQSILAYFLMVLLATAVVGVSLGVALIGHWARRRQVGFTIAPKSPKTDDSEAQCSFPFFCERPTRWLAIRTTNLAKVQKAIGLHNPTPCSWADGLARVTEKRLFLSPPVQGWVLVVGQCLPEPMDDVDDFYKFIVKLSRELGQVQFFSFNKVVNHHAWVRADSGKIYRAYAWAGETLWNEGDATAAEEALGMRCYDYGEAPQPVTFSTNQSHLANSEKVVQLAARWSIDPLSINHYSVQSTWGIAGDLSHSS